MSDKISPDKAEKLKKLQEIVLSTLHHYLDSEEIPPNQGFKNKELERRMIDAGWKPGMEWCALFSEMVWRFAYEEVYGRVPEEFDKLFSANSQQTYKNFTKAGWNTDPTEPTMGCLVIWRNKEKGSIKGHVDLCEVPDLNRVKVIGGNVSDGVRRKVKSLAGYGNYDLLGFVHLEAL